MAEKRRAVLCVSFDLLKMMLTRPGECLRVASNDVPVDASVVGVNYDWSTDQLVLCLESGSFPVTREGQSLPRLTGPVVELLDAAPARSVAFREFL